MIIIKIFWLLLPSGCANMGAAVSQKLFPHFDFPLDFGKKFRKRRIFGENKTFRGLLFGTLLGFFVFLLQKNLFQHFQIFQNISYLDYTDVSFCMMVLIPFGALCGDFVKSFFKRQFQIPPGKSWFPFDQIDWIVGSLVFSSIFIDLLMSVILLSLLFGALAHIVVKYISNSFGIDKESF